MGGMGLTFTPALVRRLLGHLGLSGPITSTSSTDMLQTVLLEGGLTLYLF